jgi:RimJ/RimL family protein N-acetyltransferase
MFLRIGSSSLGTRRSSLTKIFLETDRVRLIELSSQDSTLLLDLDSDPEVMKYISDGKPSTVEQVEAAMGRIQKIIQDHDHKYGLWAAYLKSTGEFIGWYLFRPDKKLPNDTKHIELGYRLRRKFWGMGLATEVSRALVELGFRDYAVDSIFAITMKKNLASQNVMKKLGMHWLFDYQEDEFPGNDKEAVRLSISREEWLKKFPPK